MRGPERHHVREADLYVEIVDPVTGLPCPDGRQGEIVFTTLTRKGMPLIRYRTGDISCFMAEPCPCGTALPRLGRVAGRLEGREPVGQGHILTIPDLDEALFPVPGLINYSVKIVRGGGKTCSSCLSTASAPSMTATSRIGPAGPR
jgi:phenylacetate-coenzyme A ligase PaaK-like adenylate-forming protein